MSASHRFFFNYFDVLNKNKTGHKFEMTDEYLEHLLSITGGHQRALSLCRCYRLSSRGFYPIQSCSAIWFIDLSYTKCDSVSFLSSCVVLRSLVLSGLTISDYSPLSALTSLELLSLSNSNVGKNIQIF
jgi:hypothetical protein